MSDLIKKNIEKNRSKSVTIFLKNNFRYYGKIVNFDDKYIELLDFKTNKYRTMLIEDIKELVEDEEK